MIIRSARPPETYTRIDNDTINDNALDWRELGLLVYLLSKPNHWEVSITHLAKQRKSGKDAIRVALNFLIDAGYVMRKKRGDGNVDYVIYDTKQIATISPADQPIDQPIEEPTDPIDMEWHDDELAPVERSATTPSDIPTLETVCDDPKPENPIQGAATLNRNNPNRANPTQVTTEYKQVTTDRSRSLEVATVTTIEQATWLAHYLARRIKTANDTANPKPDKWIKDIDMILRIDNQDPRLVKSVIDYIYDTDDGAFWQPMVLSGRKLRHKFDSLNAYRLRNERHQAHQSNFANRGQSDPFWDEMQRRHHNRQIGGGNG